MYFVVYSEANRLIKTQEQPFVQKQKFKLIVCALGMKNIASEKDFLSNLQLN